MVVISSRGTIIIVSALVVAMLFLSGCVIEEGCHEYYTQPISGYIEGEPHAQLTIRTKEKVSQDICDSTVLEHQIVPFLDSYTITLGKSSTFSGRSGSVVCAAIPSQIMSQAFAEPILGGLRQGTYTINIKTCGTVDKYHLQVEAKKLILIPIDVKHGELMNGGIYNLPRGEMPA